jgi:uncharacterized protein (DUF58 family)
MNELYRNYLLEGERAGLPFALSSARLSTSQMSGAHLGGRSGSSLEFREHREYQPGDDLRRVDWNAYARSDKLTVKLYREEITPHLDIVIDASWSMGLETTAKARAALGLAAALSIAAENAGFSRQLWTARDRLSPVINGAARPSTWRSIELDFSGNAASAFLSGSQSFVRNGRRNGMRIVISDLLWVAEPTAILQSITKSASAVVIVQLLGRADIEPPERGRMRLVDSETGEEREIMIDEAAIGRYRQALARLEQDWSRAARQAGAVMIRLVAEELVENWNLKDLVKAGVLKV